MKLLKEPMIHFAIAGTLLFAADAFLNRGEEAMHEVEPIRIGQGEVRWLHETFANQWQRSPSPQELSGMIANLVEEELLAREAQALGLDRGDTVVRRRLAQKLTFLMEDTSRIADPTEDELREFYSINLDRFRTQPRVSLAQIFFSVERRSDAEADANAVLRKIAAVGQGDDAAAGGDPLLLEEHFDNIDRQSLSNLFGADFADSVFALTPGSWHGPITSSYGIHLVQVTHAQAAEVRPFDEVRSLVAQEWRREREEEVKAAHLQMLREKYGVSIEEGIKTLLAPDALGGSL